MPGPTRDELDEDQTYRVAELDANTERLWLLVLGDASAEAHALPATGQLSIGRSRECDVVLQDPSISRKHAVLDVGPPLKLQDLGSANGSRVRQRRLAPDETVAIAPGEVIQLGSVMLVVQAGSAYLAPQGAARASRPLAAMHAPVKKHDWSAESIVVEDPSMQRLFKLVERVADSSISLLLLGETGVGKEIVAEAVHRCSPRATRPFLKLNCAALSETLLESELFGHEKGAFTGATQTKTGLLESAEGGSVFLDEVGEMPLSLQVKLLRVLEERKVLRVGSLTPRPIDVRFISATHRDLKSAIARGAFRHDLYFRLNGISIVIPPLRERPAEIEALARLFVQRAAASSRHGRTTGLSRASLGLLQAYAWPGNIRELRNAIERAVLLAGDDAIEPEHLPGELSAPAPVVERATPAVSETATPVGAAAGSGSAGGLRNELEALERRRIVDALEKCSGNQTRAAKMLGMPRRTLLSRIEQYGIPRPRKPAADDD